MNCKSRCKVLIAFISIMCLLFILYQCITTNYILKADRSATLLAKYLKSYCFEGITTDELTNRVSLYEYTEVCDSSILEKRVVEVIELPKNIFKETSSFKEIREYCGGLLFATSISWDGEWSGVYINESISPQSLKDYVKRDITSGHYWIEDVPYHILFR